MGENSLYGICARSLYAHGLLKPSPTPRRLDELDPRTLRYAVEADYRRLAGHLDRGNEYLADVGSEMPIQMLLRRPFFQQRESVRILEVGKQATVDTTRRHACRLEESPHAL